MEIALSVEDRLQILSLLPQEGNRVTLRIAEEIDKGINFSSEEREELKLAMSDPDEKGMRFWMWNKDAELAKPTHFTDSQSGMISDALKKLDNENKLPKSLVSLYDKFVK